MCDEVLAKPAKPSPTMEHLRCLDCANFNEDAWLDGDFDKACAAGRDIGNPEEVCGCSKGKRIEKAVTA